MNNSIGENLGMVALSAWAFVKVFAIMFTRSQNKEAQVTPSASDLELPSYGEVHGVISGYPAFVLSNDFCDDLRQDLQQGTKHVWLLRKINSIVNSRFFLYLVPFLTFVYFCPPRCIAHDPSSSFRVVIDAFENATNRIRRKTDLDETDEVCTCIFWLYVRLVQVFTSFYPVLLKFWVDPRILRMYGQTISQP